MSKALGSIIRTARNSAGFTQQALATLIGVSRAAVGQWENGTSEPSTENFLAVCKSLGVDVESAIRGQFQPSASHSNSSDLKSLLTSDRAVADAMGIVSTALIGNKENNRSTLMPMFAGLPAGEAPFCKLSVDLFSMIQRPVELKTATDVYAVMMPNEFLLPKYQMSEYIYVSASMRAVPGDHIVVHTGNIEEIEREGDAGTLSVENCLIGQMIAFGLFGVDVRQYNPETITRVPFCTGMSFHRVFPYSELIALMS